MAGIRYKGQIFSGAASFGDADNVAYNNTQSGLSATNVQDALDEVAEVASAHIKPLWVNMGTITALPVTKTVSESQTNMICTKAEVGTRSAKIGRWSVNTEVAGQVTVSGTISGSTTLKILLEQVSMVDAS